MFVRCETDADAQPIDAVHAAAFSASEGRSEPVEVGLVRALRANSGWVQALSLVAEGPNKDVAGHVVCSLGLIGDVQALGLGPLGVLPHHQGQAVGSALMHTVLGAADAWATRPWCCLAMPATTRGSASSMPEASASPLPNLRGATRFRPARSARGHRPSGARSATPPPSTTSEQAIG